VDFNRGKPSTIKIPLPQKNHSFIVVHLDNLLIITRTLFSLFLLANEMQTITTIKDCSSLGLNDTIVYDNSYTIISEVSVNVPLFS